LREQLIEYLQQHYPESLPCIRTAFASDGSGDESLDLSFKRPEHRKQEIVTANS